MKRALAAGKSSGNENLPSAAPEFDVARLRGTFSLRTLLRFLRAIRLPLCVAILCDPSHGAAARDGLVIQLLRDRLEIAASLQEKPLRFSRLHARSDERPFAFGFLAFEHHLQFPVAPRLEGFLAENRIAPAIPEHHG